MNNKAALILWPLGLILLLALFVDEKEGSVTDVNTIAAPAAHKEEVPQPVTKTQPKIQERSCHPSYSGCLKPDASDYDCAGGSGNGPYYTGRVQVVGPDVFGLDRDGNGWGCE